MSCPHKNYKILKNEFHVLTGTYRVEAECRQCGLTGVALGVRNLIDPESVTWRRIEATEVTKK